MSTANRTDYLVIVLYALLMVRVGFYVLRFNRGAAEYFRGGSRIPWLVAGLSCFMSGFSAWTFTGAAGVAYRFAPNWYAGVEIHTRSEYPLFDLDNFEHRVFYAGPSLHYSQKNWWATLTWNYQVYGKGVDEPADGQTFAEETRQLFRLKVGFNF